MEIAVKYCCAFGYVPSAALTTEFAMQTRQSQSSLRSKRHTDRILSTHKRCLFQNSSLIRCINFARFNSRFSPAVFLCYSGIRSNKPGRGQGGNSMLWANTLSVGENFIYIKKVRILAKLYFCSLYDKNYVNVD